MKPLTITFFGFAPLTYWGGYETIIIKMAEKLSNKGHKVNIITGNQTMSNALSIIFYQRLFERRTSKDDIKGYIPLVNVYEYRPDSLIPMSKSFDDIQKIMRKSDIIYTRNEIIDFLLISHFCGKYHPPIICGIHTSIIYLYKKTFVSNLHNIVYKKFIYKMLLDKCLKVLTQNKFDTELLISKYGIEKDKIYDILPFIDNKFFCPRNVIRIDNKFKVLFAGRLTEQKGIDILCDSIKLISAKPEFNDMTFTIVGSGELDYMIKELANKYDNIKYTGFATHDKLVELYNSHDVIVLPSRWETTLKVVLEAQACGLPVIVSDIPGPNELIKHGDTGFIVEPENHGDMSEKILIIFQLKKYNNEKYIEMRNLSVINAQKYDIDIIIEKLESLFIKISDNNR